jgi:hypothetical protein
MDPADAAESLTGIRGQLNENILYLARIIWTMVVDGFPIVRREEAQCMATAKAKKGRAKRSANVIPLSRAKNTEVEHHA